MRAPGGDAGAPRAGAGGGLSAKEERETPALPPGRTAGRPDRRPAAAP